MSIFNFLRGFFGMPPDGNANRRGDCPEERPNGFRNPIWSVDDDDDDDEDLSPLSRRPRSHFSFHIDTNPLEIHRFFEQQMESIVRAFGAFGSGSFGAGSIFSSEGLNPWEFAITEEERKKGESKRQLRDQYVKELPSVDSDLDDSVHSLSPEEIDELMRYGGSSRKSSPLDLIRPQGQGIYLPSGFASGQSVIKKTVTMPNGAVEHHTSMSDTEGNKEVTVTRTLGKQMYSVTTKTNAEGKEERIEKFVNMEEGDLGDFEKKWRSKL